MSISHAAGTDQLKGPIRIVVGYAPGNGGDLIARLLAKKMTEQTGVSFYVDNRVGGGSRIAAQLVKDAPPDGKTMLISTFSVLGLFPMLSDKSAYQLSDFQPVAHIADSAVTITVAYDAPYKTIPEYIAWLKQNPGKAQMGNEAVGTPAHLLTIEFGQKVGQPITFVPYKGVGQLLSDIMGHQLPAGTFGLPSVYQLHQQHQVRILAIASAKRSGNAPDLPTLKEEGVNLVVDSWYGAWFPKGTSKTMTQAMSDALTNAIKQPDVQKQLRLLGLDPTGYGLDQFVKIQADRQVAWKQIVKDTGFHLDE